MSLLLLVYFVPFCCFLASRYFPAFSSEQGIEPLGNKILKALPCYSMPLIINMTSSKFFTIHFFFQSLLSCDFLSKYLFAGVLLNAVFWEINKAFEPWPHG